jgi:hypothetical protein
MDCLRLAWVASYQFNLGPFKSTRHSFGNIGIISVAFSVNTFIIFSAILGLTLWIDKRRRKKRSKLV